MHDKYPLLFVAALGVLAGYLHWWPSDGRDSGRISLRACLLALGIVVFSGTIWLVAYDPDAIAGSPKAWLQSGSFFAFWGAVFFTVLFGAFSVYHNAMQRRPVSGQKIVASR